MSWRPNIRLDCFEKVRRGLVDAPGHLVLADAPGVAALTDSPDGAVLVDAPEAAVLDDATVESPLVCPAGPRDFDPRDFSFRDFA